MAEDMVNHPNHYTKYKGFEVIDVARQLRGPDGSWGFELGNAFKYISRAGWKNPEKTVEDLKKAIFYIQHIVDRLEAEKTSAVEDVEVVEDDDTSLREAYCPECNRIVHPSMDIPNAYFCLAGHGYVIDVDDRSTTEGLRAIKDAVVKLHSI